MNLNDKTYSQFHLCCEMMDTVDVVRKFDPKDADFIVESAKKTGHILFSGEGSSRILPAKNAIRKAFQNQIDGKGYSLVEVLTSCPTNWGLSPEKSLIPGLRPGPPSVKSSS